ncbi:MAG: GNAT family N-acetyltransferase [Fusobacteriaceae bacterium]
MYLRKLSELDSELIKEVIRECKKYYKDIEGVSEYNFTEEFIQEEVDNFMTPYMTNEKYGEEFKIGIFEKIDNIEKIFGITQVLINHRIVGVTTIGFTLIKQSDRGKGIGSWLHKMIVKISQKKNQKKLTLSVDIKNISAQKIWKHLGYKKVEEMRVSYKYEETTIIFLEKSIFSERCD